MTLHKFVCDECEKHSFYTTFAPYFDEEPATCPCCSQGKTVHYVGEIIIPVEVAL